MPGRRRSGRPNTLADLVVAYLGSVDQWRSSGLKGPAVIDMPRPVEPETSEEALPQPRQAPVPEETPQPGPAEAISPEELAPAPGEAAEREVAPGPEPEREMEDAAFTPRPVEDLAAGTDLEIKTEGFGRDDEALQAHIQSVMRHFLGQPMRAETEEGLAGPEEDTGEAEPGEGEEVPEAGEPVAEEVEAPIAPAEVEEAAASQEVGPETPSDLEDAFAPLWRGWTAPLGPTPAGGIGPTTPEVDALAALREEVMALRSVLENIAAQARAQRLGQEAVSPTSGEEAGIELPTTKVTLAASSLPPGTLLDEFIAALEDVPGVAAVSLLGYDNGTATFHVLVRSTSALVRGLMGMERFRPASLRVGTDNNIELTIGGLKDVSEVRPTEGAAEGEERQEEAFVNDALADEAALGFAGTALLAEEITAAEEPLAVSLEPETEAGTAPAPAGPAVAVLTAPNGKAKGVFELDTDVFLNAQHFVTIGGTQGPPHPHSWRLRATFKGGRRGGSIVIGFADARGALETQIERYQGSLLNRIEPFDTVQPTSENIAAVLYQRVKEAIQHMPIVLKSLAVWESPTNCVVYSESGRDN